jgi:DNA-directed RNA polymerase subunit alpha
MPQTASKAASLAVQTRLGVPPQIKIDHNTRNYGKYTVAPLPIGFGVTLGNAVRRTLLGGAKGAAVTKVKVAGIKHEFSTIPNVREDMTAVILNLKGLRFRFKQDKPATIRLKVKGEGPFTAADLELPSHVEVAQPNYVILTGDNEATDVDMEFTAETGYGYSPSEERGENGKMPIGEIAIDAAFSPIKKANFQALRASVPEIARAGQPFEKLVIEAQTDGTLTAEEAVRQVTGTLSGHFGLISNAEWSRNVQIHAIPYRRPIESLELKPRSLSRLQESGFTDVNSLMKVVRKEGVGQIEGLGKVSVKDILARLSAQNLSEEDQIILAALSKIRKKKVMA